MSTTDDERGQGQQPEDPLAAGTPSDEEIEAARAGDLTDPSGETNPNSEHFTAPAGDALGREEVHSAMLEQQEQGFVGTAVDPTPNENYSLETPTEAPTPETDPELARQADQAIRGNRLTNVEEDSARTAARDREDA